MEGGYKSGVCWNLGSVSPPSCSSGTTRGTWAWVETGDTDHLCAAQVHLGLFTQLIGYLESPGLESAHRVENRYSDSLGLGVRFKRISLLNRCRLPDILGCSWRSVSITG